MRSEFLEESCCLTRTEQHSQALHSDSMACRPACLLADMLSGGKFAMQSVRRRNLLAGLANLSYAR